MCKCCSLKISGIFYSIFILLNILVSYFGIINKTYNTDEYIKIKNELKNIKNKKDNNSDYLRILLKINYKFILNIFKKLNNNLIIKNKYKYKNIFLIFNKIEFIVIYSRFICLILICMFNFYLLYLCLCKKVLKEEDKYQFNGGKYCVILSSILIIILSLFCLGLIIIRILCIICYRDYYNIEHEPDNFEKKNIINIGIDLIEFIFLSISFCVSINIITELEKKEKIELPNPNRTKIQEKKAKEQDKQIKIDENNNDIQINENNNDIQKHENNNLSNLPLKNNIIEQIIK